MDILTKVLAFICQICPFCIFARRFPNSKFARTMKAAEKSCPCCKAYAKLKSIKRGRVISDTSPRLPNR